MSQTKPTSARRPPPVPVFGLVHISGSRHGTTEMLFDDELVVGTATDADIHLPADRESAVAPHHATLERHGPSYRLRAEPERWLRVNDEPRGEAVLEDGDVIELGDGGPRLRFRVYKQKPKPTKTMTEALADCVDCARAKDGALGKTGSFVRLASRDLVKHTSRGFRWGLLSLVLLVFSTAFLTYQNLRLEHALTGERQRLNQLAQLLEHREKLTSDDLGRIRTELTGHLTGTLERVSALEEKAGAGRRVIQTADDAVVFLQGSYGFLHGLSRRQLRFAVDPGGRPVTDGAGNPMVTTDGAGPPVESFFTGTGFVAGDDGLVVTNRHVARPWDFDEAALAVAEQGYEPVVNRFLGYLPGVAEPFLMELVAASDDADVAILRAVGEAALPAPLELSETPVEPGDEVIVLGYPTGIRALLARAEPAFVETLMHENALGFWSVTERLAAAGEIKPLATRGIVGQVTRAAVVYDADTTSGGSGGPVVDLRGEVVAVNAAILPEFGGANQGVPAAAAERLLATVRPPRVRILPDELPIPLP